MSKFRKSKKNFFSIVIIPPSHKRSLTLNIPTKFIKVSAIVICLLLIFFSISFFLSVKTSYRLTNYKNLQVTNEKNKQQLSKYNEEVDKIQKELADLVKRESEIRKILGQGTEAKKKINEIAVIGKKFKKLSSYLAKDQEIIDENKLNKVLQHKTSLLNEELNKSKKSYFGLFSSAKKFVDRFDSIPSIWPVYGSINSGFGWRGSPYSRRSEFHKGLDIGGRAGTSIRTTAKGKVEFAGWSGGYGLLIIVNHGNGYKTLYGHLSRIQVRQGQMVFKGSVIGNLGASGFATGPHLHYEVHQWGVAVYPNRYLNLRVRTALL